MISFIPKPSHLEPVEGCHRGRRGQTLVISIMVMFILAVIAAIFIALVARNLFRSERSSRSDSVAQIAEAGIRYADEMLTSSEEGADWRPEPDHVGCTTAGHPPTNTEPQPDTGTGYAAPKPNWEYLRDVHPDFKWVRAYWPTELPAGAAPGTGYAGPTGGFTAFETGGGRFLLRVSYNPDPKDPISKYIKIESVGRWGAIAYDPASGEYDPTTLRHHGYDQLRREVTAYKPIGITDYLRFVTNRSSREMDMPLGCPGFTVDFGRTKGSVLGVRGAPLRVNGNLMLYGTPGMPNDDTAVRLYLRGISEVGGGDPVPVDRWEVAGQIKFADPDMKVRLRRVLVDQSPPTEDGPFLLKPSDASDYLTEAGSYRDGSDATDSQRYARGVKRIEPPLVDQQDPTNTTTRYRLLTLNSGERVRRGQRWINLGLYGWGRGIYINNLRDTQRYSESLIGGQTLRADWLDVLKPRSVNWVGPYYVPPACVITLFPGDTDNDGQPDFSITRGDVTGAGGQKAIWFDASGAPRPDWGATIKMPYPDARNGRTLTAALGGDGRKIEGNGVIYAEGNIRIRGMLPKGMQLTIVSNQTIYIDGNVLKYREPGQVINDADPYRGADNTCGLALLARENVCVNTTQFFSPLNSISADDVGSDAGDDQPPFHVVVSNTPESTFRCAWEFGPWESENGAAPADYMLCLRHSGQYGPSYINTWLNMSSALPMHGMLQPNQVFSGLPEHVWGVGDPNFSSSGWGVGSSFVGDVFTLAQNPINANLLTSPGLIDYLQIALDQTTFTRNNYLLGGVAVQPCDIRIEAVLYAQEGSFFVIPGRWFNPNPNDRFDPKGGGRLAGYEARFPFFGQPLDVRVIVDGAVSENIPAAIADVEEWMSKWGRIPDTYGSSGSSTAHPGEGLTILYDDHVGWPLADLANTQSWIRTDAYGRALPIAPKLPVCGSLIYSGDVM